MVTREEAKLVRAPARIVIGITQEPANGVYPFGGKEIGKVKQVRFASSSTPLTVIHEGSGEIGEMLEAPNRYIFACYLRGHDNDALKALFGVRASVGSQTGHQVVLFPSLVSPGKSAIGRGVKVLVVPDDPVNVDALLIYQAVPDLQEGAEMSFSRNEELGFPMRFECIRDTFGRVAAIGRLQDLKLVP